MLESLSLATWTAFPSLPLGMDLEKVGERFSYSRNSYVQNLLPVLLKGHFLVKILEYIDKLLPVIPVVQ